MTEQQLTFDILKNAWKKLLHKKSEELKTLAPYLSSPEQIFIKKINETEDNIIVQFSGLENCTTQTMYIPQIKRVIFNWLKKISYNVKLMQGDINVLLVVISKELKFTESKDKQIKNTPNSNDKSKNNTYIIRERNITNITNLRIIEDNI